MSALDKRLSNGHKVTPQIHFEEIDVNTKMKGESSVSETVSRKWSSKMP